MSNDETKDLWQLWTEASDKDYDSSKIQDKIWGTMLELRAIQYDISTIARRICNLRRSSERDVDLPISVDSRLDIYFINRMLDLVDREIDLVVGELDRRLIKDRGY